MPLSVPGHDLALELVDPGPGQFVRLYPQAEHPDSDWKPPPPRRRNNRVDPPVPYQSAYAVLYMGSNLPCIATECRVLTADTGDNWTLQKGIEARFHVARYTLAHPAVFLPIDGPNADRLLPFDPSTQYKKGYEQSRKMAYEVFLRYGRAIHGLSWRSYHRGQPGRVYALWHRHKRTTGLTVEPKALHLPLAADPQWQAFLAANTQIQVVP